MEIGQPLHAFDYHLLKGVNGQTPKIIVRRAAEGEKFTTLDGKERTLTNQMLLIADETKGIALAGVMGGQNTEINDKTVDVLIESAAFKPGEKAADPLQMYLADIFTIAVNLAGICGVSIPCGFTSGKLPIGLQIIGPKWGEETMFRVAHAYEQATPWHKEKPPL